MKPQTPGERRIGGPVPPVAGLLLGLLFSHAIVAKFDVLLPMKNLQWFLLEAKSAFNKVIEGPGVVRFHPDNYFPGSMLARVSHTLLNQFHLNAPSPVGRMDHTIAKRPDAVIESQAAKGDNAFIDGVDKDQLRPKEVEIRSVARLGNQ